MIDRGLLKLEDIRVIWESPLIANPMWAVPKGLPADLRKDLLDLFLGLAKEDLAVAEAAEQGKTIGFEPVTHENYATYVTIAQEQRRARRQQ
jgi:phosphonate transport system substrate-binding protein